MAALMEVPVKFIWTHDAFRVGEDGPTHEPVEQEAQIRLMEKLKNHKGHNSMLVLRPADAEETTIACKLAMENTKNVPQAGITPPCSAIPIQQQAIVSSATPAWKNAPLKSPFLKACVFFRKPSVLSEFERSAEATIMFST